MPYADQRKVIERLTREADKMLRASEEEYINKLIDRYKEFEDNITAKLQAMHAEMWPGGKVTTYSDYLALRGDIRTEQALIDEMRRLNVDVGDGMLNALTKQYKDSYGMTAWSLDSTTPPTTEIKYRMEAEPIIRQLVSEPWSGAMFSQRIGVITNFMAQDIQQEVTQAMLSGDSVPELGKRIRNIIGIDDDSGYKYRAKMIARTELLRASNIARRSLMDQNEDVIETWIFTATADGRVCDDCIELNGKTKSEVEQEGYDPDVEPPLHTNCRCVFRPQPKSWKELLGPELSKGMTDLDKWDMAAPVDPQYAEAARGAITVMDYDDWVKQRGM